MQTTARLTLHNNICTQYVTAHHNLVLLKLKQQSNSICHNIS